MTAGLKCFGSRIADVKHAWVGVKLELSWSWIFSILYQDRQDTADPAQVILCVRYTVGVFDFPCLCFFYMCALGCRGFLLLFYNIVHEQHLLRVLARLVSRSQNSIIKLQSLR